MKPILPVFLGLALAAGSLPAAPTTLTLWNFNSNPPDASLSTGSSLPASGEGMASLLGGITATFASGTATDTASDNTGWNTASYPLQGTLERMAGVQFKATTRGFSNIVLRFEIRVSNTASKYARVQYTTNGIDFINSMGVTNTANVFTQQVVSLGGLPGVDDNTNFAFRVVTEFESTATGSGTAGYVTASASAYTANGTVRFDLVSVSGDSIMPDNLPPSITEIADQTIAENSSVNNIGFFIGDFDTDPNDLVLTVSSSNTELLPLSGIVLGGNGDFRDISVTPAPDRFGTSVVTVTVTDAGALSASESFLLTVVALNFPPTISPITHQSTLTATPTAPIAFIIGDTETAVADLTLSKASSNPALVPAEGIVFDNSNTENRSVTITPATNQSGTALITLTVTDGGGRSTSTRFVVMVVPSASVKLCESFSYPDGSLLTNSAFFWTNHSGILGQLPLTNGAARVTFAQNEDMHAPLLGGTISPGGAQVLYASFTVNFSTLPLIAGEYFFHYNFGTFRGRIFSATSNAAPGALRVGVANGSATWNAQAPVDIFLDTNYTVVTRYDVDSATTTIWVNPTSESDPFGTATDVVSAVSVNSVSLRQNASIGTLVVDNLKVGLSFADVVSPGVGLQIAVVGNGVEISWPESAEGYVLEATDTLSVNWMTTMDSVSVSDGRKRVFRTGITGNQFFRLFKP